LGAGGALALLISLLYPIVTDARMLAHTSGMPLLGVVTHHKGDAEKRGDLWRLASFSACGCGLLMAFAGVVILPGLFA